MPRTLTAAIETESNKARLVVVDLVKVKFPDPVGWRYWSNFKYTYSGQVYSPRILNIGDWSRSMNPETDNLSITLGNADGTLTEIHNAVEVELAEVTLVRYYPVINEAIDPLWVGYGGAMTIKEDVVDWSIHFGFRGFSHRGLRKVIQNCWKVFADGQYCPYDGVSIGSASVLSSGMSPVQTNMSVNTPTQYTAGDIVRIESEYMRCLTGGANPIDVERGLFGSTITSHGGSQLVYHESCQKSRVACKKRRMNGPPDTGGDGRRYFGGWSEHTPNMFIQKNKKKEKPRWFMQQTSGNESLHGNVIPTVYGHYRLRDVQAAAAADAREFKHALFIVCEGQIQAVAANLIRVDGYPPDDIPNPNKSGFNVLREDSIHFWDGKIGQRQSLAIMSNRQDAGTDTYAENPYLFNLVDGDGPSLSDVAALRIRIEEGGEEFDNNLPVLDVQMIGRITRTIQSYIDSNPSLVTVNPDPIEVAVDYLVNKKFGARLDISRIDLTSALAASQYCKEYITSTSAEFVNLSGTVTDGPSGSAVYGSTPNNWIFVNFNQDIADGSLAGRTLKITEVGKEQTKLIIHNRTAERVRPFHDNEFTRLGFVDEYDYGLSSFQMVYIDGTWDTNKTPTVGNSLQVTGYGSGDLVPRFTFNGVISEDDSVEKHLAMILEGCNGYYFPRGSKIVFGIRKAENLATIDALPHLKDHGTDRNILRSNGISSLVYERKSSIQGAYNNIEVTYNDVEHGFQDTVINVFDEDLQLRLGQILAGDTSRIVNSKSLRLIGTITKDQSQRLGALALRESILMQDSFTFQMSLKDSLKLEPGDVRKLDSLKVNNENNKQISKLSPYVRIARISESSKFTATIECFRHENGYYDDSILNLISRSSDRDIENPLNFPKDVIPSPPVEVIDISHDGGIMSVINIEVTYP